MKYAFVFASINLMVVSLLSTHSEAQVGVGNPNGESIQTDYWPATSYAAIDVSADHAKLSLDSGTLAVGHVVLDDGNSVAYSFGDGTSKVGINTWANGTGPAFATTIVTMVPPKSPIPSYPDFLRTETFPGVYLNGTGGTATVSAQEVFYRPTVTGDDIWGNNVAAIFSAAGTDRISLSLPGLNGTWESLLDWHQYQPRFDHAGLVLMGASSSGMYGYVPQVWFTDTDGQKRYYGAYTEYSRETETRAAFVSNSDLVTLFDDQREAYDNIHLFAPHGDNIVMINANYEARFMNKWGRTVGQPRPGSGYQVLYWNYPKPDVSKPPFDAVPISIGDGGPCGISDEDRIIYSQNRSVDGRQIQTGFLWKEGVPLFCFNTYLSQSAFRSYDSVSPYSISNETSEGTFYVLTRVDSKTDYKNIVWKSVQPSTPPGSAKPPRVWSMNEVILSNSVTAACSSINSSGIIVATGNGGHALLLVPAKFDVVEGRINYGFDPPMKGISPIPDDPIDEYWASVVKGDLNRNVNLIMPKSLAQVTKLYVNSEGEKYLAFSPRNSVLTGDVTNLTLSGLTSNNAVLGSDEIQKVQIEARIGDVSKLVVDGTTFSRLNVMVLPKRTVSIGIYRVYDKHSPKTKYLGGPTDAQIKQELDDIYQQSGVTFTIESAEPNPIDVRYDIEKEAGAKYHDGRVQDSEQAIIAHALNDKPGKIHVILAANSGLLLTDEQSGVKDWSRAETDDWESHICSFLFVNTINERNAGSVTLIESHEVGHPLIMGSDPITMGNHEIGPFPLPLADGLMKKGRRNSAGEANTLGRWFCHEDWEKANTNAKLYVYP